MTPNKEHKELLKLIAGENWHLDRVFSQLAKELASVLSRYRKFKGKSLWVGNEAVRKDIKRVLQAHNIRLTNHIENQILKSWNLSHSHKDELVSAYTAGVEIPKSLNATMLHRNSNVIESYLKYGRGRSFSKRVWANTRQVDGHIKRFLKEGLSEGRSAVELAKDVKQYLKEPDRRFRRIRDKNGRLILSSPAKSYKAGRGVYRSSYKNALRLTRNEINIGYRMADVERRKQIPFIVGITVKLSPAHPRPDICDDLVGDYPSSYVHVGFHPNCLCYTVSKLLPKSEFKKYLQTGEIPSKFKITGIDSKRLNYVAKHKDKLKKSYFLQDNRKFWEMNGNTASPSFPELSTSNYEGLLSKQKVFKGEEKLLYSRFSGYVKTAHGFTINSYHRGNLKRITPQMKDVIEKTTATLDNVIRRNKLPQNIQTYRMIDKTFAYEVLGIDTFDLSKIDLTLLRGSIVGKDIADKGFLSASCIDGRNVFSERAIMLKMKAKKGTNYFMPKNKEESEIIFGRNLTNKIKDVKITDNKMIIYTELF